MKPAGSGLAPGSEIDERLMGLALALGRRNLGLTWPNPSVGAVLAEPSTGRILAAAATSRGGRPHAEPLALLAASGEAARGATLYVSLEPCSHHGRTPPCTDAIIASGIGRVVSGMEDPDPRVAGRGHALLRDAGIAVTSGIGADRAARDHRGHVTRIRLGRPSVTCKLALTADGFAGRLDGQRLMVTGEGANARTHLLRAHADAIMVGVATAIADDPCINVRLPGLEDRRPVRVVVDTHLRLPVSMRVVASAATGPCWILCSEEADGEAEHRLAGRGVQIVRVPRSATGRVDLAEGMRALAARGLTRVLCEAGPTLADAFAGADLLDELILIRSSTGLGEPGIVAIGQQLDTTIGKRLRVCTEDVVGPDRIVTYERQESCSPVS